MRIAAVYVDDSPFSVGVQADSVDHGDGSARYSATLQFTITNGTGSGEFAPCFGGPQYGGAYASLSFGSVFVNAAPTCPTTLAGGDFIPFVFGVQQTEQMSLGASAVAGPNGAGVLAYLFGFAVLDSNGDPLPNAIVTVVDLHTELPEPRLLAPVGIALALGWALRRRMRA